LNITHAVALYGVVRIARYYKGRKRIKGRGKEVHETQVAEEAPEGLEEREEGGLGGWVEGARGAAGGGRRGQYICPW
jgi:hypothetical protein